MKSERRVESSGESGESLASGLDAQETARALQLGLTAPEGPVDELMDRLCAAGGHEWLLSTIDTALGEEVGALGRKLAIGAATLEEVASIKERSKALFTSKDSQDARLLGAAGYFFAVAAAVVHHRRIISSRSREHLDLILGDLAESAPRPWSELLRRATR